MKARCLKMRKDVWTCTLFSGSQWGVCMGRQVMYYLEWDLPLCLIRAWLREAVTAAFFQCTNVCSGMRVNSWPLQRTWSILHTLTINCRKCTLLCYQREAGAVHGQTVSSGYLACIVAILGSCGPTQSPGCCLDLVTAMCRDRGELCFIQSLIKVETLSGVLRLCSASKT